MRMPPLLPRTLAAWSTRRRTHQNVVSTVSFVRSWAPSVAARSATRRPPTWQAPAARSCPCRPAAAGAGTCVGVHGASSAQRAAPASPPPPRSPHARPLPLGRAPVRAPRPNRSLLTMSATRLALALVTCLLCSWQSNGPSTTAEARGRGGPPCGASPQALVAIGHVDGIALAVSVVAVVVLARRRCTTPRPHHF